MKRTIILAIAILLSMMLFVSCFKSQPDVSSSEMSRPGESAASAIELTIDDVVWLVEPTLAYENIRYCCDHFTKDGEEFIDSKTGAVLPDFHGGHGGWDARFCYDEKRNVIGYTTSAPGVASYDKHPAGEFEKQFPTYKYTLNLFWGYDSTKVKKEDFDGEDMYDIKDALTGRCAIALGGKLLTGFDFDDGETIGYRKMNSIIAVSKGGKWGVIGRDGSVVAPFVFEKGITIDESTVFMKYDGKYGIISVPPQIKIVEPQNYLKEEEAPHAGVNAKDGLRLRSGPGTNYEIINLIPDGAMIAERGYNNNNHDWLYVQYRGSYGWVSNEFLNFDGDGMAKPVVYLYPQKPTDVNVKVEFDNGRFTCTYPEYESGWNVKAYPGGKIMNKSDGLEYSYLYWEARSNVKYDMSKGFVVMGKDTAKFLREKLALLGLTPREYNEFIVYWLPLMQGNNYNLISFQKEAYTNAAKLKVTPKPDTTIRVFMVYTPLEKPIYIPEQILKTPQRNGFTVVEWGGTLLGSGFAR